MKSLLLKLALISSTFLLVACGGGGGGGGGGSSPSYTRYTASDFQTSEYSAQAGLGVVKAASMYANIANCQADGGTTCYSYQGQGRNIAVNDSGINATEASTGSSINVHGYSSYDFVSNTSGSSADANGHGTHVAGIIAAPKNNSGMHGIAPDASLINFRIADAAGSISLTDSQWASLSTRALADHAYISNNSWGSSAAITTVSAADINVSNPLTVAAYQNYVANGGVVVFAAGNSGLTQVSIQAGLPYRFSGLEAGWLAVMAVDLNGNEPAYTNRCGVSKAWCLAAPGGGDNQAADGVYSMYNNGSYTRLSGTSMATPMVSGALAVLKNNFPNLSYQQIRDRLLTTANKTGQYANSDIFGQGLMDLSAASAPVGTLSLPTGGHTSGGMGSVTMSKISLPAQVASAMQNSKILVVDSYQKAPFFVSASNFVQEAKIQSTFAGRHLNSLSTALPVEQLAEEKNLGFSYTQGLNSAFSMAYKQDRVGVSNGLRSEQPLMRQLGISYLPHLSNSSTNTNAFGYSSSIGKTKIAFIGSMPNTRGNYLSDINEDKAFMGARNSFSLITQRDHEEFKYGATYSSANSFAQPLGLVSSGAFGFTGTQASSIGTFFHQSLFGGATWLKSSVELASLNASSTGLNSFQNGKYSVLKLSADHYFDKNTAITFGVKQDQALSGQMNTRIPSSIDENGNIGYQNYASGFGSLFNSSQVNFDVHHRLNAVSRIKGGLMYEQRPYGLNGAGAAFFYEHRL